MAARELQSLCATAVLTRGTEFPMDENSGDINFKDGVRTVTLSSWQEFHQEVYSLRSKRGYVWRGQKGDWPLKSTFDRNVQSKNQHDRTKKLKHHLGNFKEAMNKSYPNVLPQDEDSIWALGRHYGLKAPLLDWTLSPYIAAYFAFIEGHDPNDRNDNYRYVFALNRSVERMMSKRKKATQILSSDRSVLFIDRLPYPNPRFTAQKGILTKAFQGNDLWKYVKSFSGKKPSEVVIVKFEIPTKDREECLRALHLMNIDHTSLLLDLHDVVDCCNDKLLPRRED